MEDRDTVGLRKMCGWGGGECLRDRYKQTGINGGKSSRMEEETQASFERKMDERVGRGFRNTNVTETL